MHCVGERAAAPGGTFADAGLGESSLALPRPVLPPGGGGELWLLRPRHRVRQLRYLRIVEQYCGFPPFGLVQSLVCWNWSAWPKSFEVPG